MASNDALPTRRRMPRQRAALTGDHGMRCQLSGRLVGVERVRRLVREQMEPGSRVRVEAVLAEKEVVAEGERIGAKHARQTTGHAIGVKATRRQVGAKRPLEPAAASGIQLVTARGHLRTSFADYAADALPKPSAPPSRIDPFSST